MSEGGDVAQAADMPIACSLSTAELQTQLREWQEVLGRVATREAIRGGLRLTFDRSARADVIADLAMREHACCPFLHFTLHVDPAALPVLEVRAPAAAQQIVDELFGSGT